MSGLHPLINKKTGFYKSFDGTPIYYEIRGQGSPLVFIYGIGCLINHWHHQIEFFSKTNSVITFDIRGHHQSVPVSSLNNLKFTDLAEDLRGLLEYLGFSSAHVVGHSFGAPYIIETYRLYPDLFRSIVFINGFSRNPIKKTLGLELTEPFFYFLKLQHSKYPDLWNALWKTMIDNPLSFQLAALAGGFNLRVTQFKDIEMYGRGVARLELPLFFEIFEQLLRFDGTDVLPKITKPTFIISGERDFIAPPSYQKELATHIPGAEFLLVPYGSHCCQLDFPEFMNLKMQKFFEDSEMT